MNLKESGHVTSPKTPRVGASGATVFARYDQANEARVADAEFSRVRFSIEGILLLLGVLPFATFAIIADKTDLDRRFDAVLGGNLTAPKEKKLTKRVDGTKAWKRATLSLSPCMRCE